MTTRTLLLLLLLPAVVAKDQKLSPGTLGMGALFGSSLTVGYAEPSDTDTPRVVVGAPGISQAFLFNCYRQETCTETNVGTMIMDGRAPGDHFGWSVSMDRELLAVGAPNTAASRGAMYMYHCAANTNCVLNYRMQPSELEPGDQFGYSVAAGLFETVAVGAPSTQNGTVFVFDCHSRACPIGANNYLIKLDGENPGDRFGASVSYYYKKAFLVVGAPNYNQNTGAVYVYDCSAITSCKLVEKIEAPSKTQGMFGHSVSISENNILVGAPNEGHGAAYIISCSEYSRPCLFRTRLWLDLPADSLFGISVSLSGTDAVVGTIRTDRVSTKGTAHAFRCTESPDVWRCSEVGGLTYPENRVGDCFGYGVATFDGHVAVGAPGWDENMESGKTSFSYFFPGFFSLAPTLAPASALLLLLPTLMLALL